MSQLVIILPGSPRIQAAAFPTGSLLHPTRLYSKGGPRWSPGHPRAGCVTWFGSLISVASSLGNITKQLSTVTCRRAPSMWAREHKVRKRLSPPQTGRATGRNSHSSAAFIFIISATCNFSFVLGTLRKYKLSGGRKGGTGAWLPPSLSLSLLFTISSFKANQPPTFSRYLFGFKVAHIHTHTAWMVASADGAQCLSLGRTVCWSWDAAAWPRGTAEWTTWAPMKSNSWNCPDTV